MRARSLLALGVLSCSFSVGATPLPSPVSAPPPGDPRLLYLALNNLQVDSSRVYSVRHLYLRRGEVSLVFSEGKLAFLKPLDGRITGAVFVGRGRALATPRDPAERLSLARFLGVPLLDQPFFRAYLRFTDETASELGRELNGSGALASPDPDFAESWNTTVATLNPGQSLRVMMDWLSASPQPYFYAGLASDTVGVFDILVDPRREERVLIGQPRTLDGMPYYDIWASFPPNDTGAPRAETFVPLDYRIDTTIAEDLSTEATATLHLKALRGGDQMLVLELSCYLRVSGVTDEAHRSLAFFQNEALNRHQMARRGNDLVFVVLPEVAQPGQEFHLLVRYSGRVINDAGNGVFFVGDRGSWYPHPGGPDRFVPFDLTFRWPRRLTLVATGEPVEQAEAADQKIGRWQTREPIARAGFNLGEYESHSVRSGGAKIELYANRQLEEAILAQLRQRVIAPGGLLPPFTPPASRLESPGVLFPDLLPPPSPAAVLKRLGSQILDSIRFLETWNGAFPFSRLEVSQIPGGFGQGWPGLLYLSTLVFLPPEAQAQVGVPPQAQQQISQLMPFHEVAHQWWGNVVGAPSYRDAWIEEAMASYLALLYADRRTPSQHALQTWLERFRTVLAARESRSGEPAEEAGPLSFSYRLNSSKSPQAYDPVVYGKGPWVIHMLRMMLRNPRAKDPDAKFRRLLHALLEQHRFETLSTSDLQHAVEQVMTPEMNLEGDGSMGWFFDEWVRSTGIPRYSVEFRTHARGKEWVVRGTLFQKDVPELFTASVPLYVPRASGPPALLGDVVTTGPITSFQFTSRLAVRRLLIDPHHTLLCFAQ